MAKAMWGEPLNAKVISQIAHSLRDYACRERVANRAVSVNNEKVNFDLDRSTASLLAPSR